MMKFEVSVVFETDARPTLTLLADSHGYEYTGDGSTCTVTAYTKGMKQAKARLSHILSLGEALKSVVLNQTMKKTILDTQSGIGVNDETEEKDSETAE